MIPFFSPRIHRKEQVVGRAVITAAAVLFLLAALLYALPSKDQLADLLEQSGLSGYSRVEETTPSRPAELEEFYDHPLTQQDPLPSGDPENESPIDQMHFKMHYSSGGVNAKIA